MKPFNDGNFLLQTYVAQRLYHDYAKGLPIIDYHCHLNPAYVAENHIFDNLSKIWLEGDHYKWRAMRTNGIAEEYITGKDTTDWEKFEKWAETVPYTMCNPLYHWTHLELNTALPTWRTDKARAVENPEAFKAYIDRLSEVSGVEIKNFGDVIAALQKRHDFFEQVGCRLSDHGIGGFYAEDYTPDEIDSIFTKVYGGEALSEKETAKFKSAMLVEFAVMDHDAGWTQQFHYGVIRNNNSRMMAAIGPDTGFDSIGDFTVAENMAKFLDRIASRDKLAKTIIYNLNPRDNELVATMIGNFQDGRYGAGKIQFGSGWWFLDQKNGMERQMTALSNLGLLSRFVGMLTDSRSFLSYPRHEYFRRTLCNLIGNEIEQGLLPASEIDFIGREIVAKVCYGNAKDYFKF